MHTVLTDNGVQFTDTLPADEDPEAEAAIDAIWAARGESRGSTASMPSTTPATSTAPSTG